MKNRNHGFCTCLLIIFFIAAGAGNLYTQNTGSSKLILSHPLNYNPGKKPVNNYHNFLFSFGVPVTLNVYAIMVQFKEDNTPNTTGNGRFDVSSNYPDSVDAPPHDSLYFANHLEFLKNYYYKSSKGQLIINYHILGSVKTLSQTMDQYSPGKNEGLNKMGRLFNEAWTAADSVAYFLSGVDPNSNNTFMIFHAGTGRDVDLVSSGIFAGVLDIPSIYLSNSSLKQIYGDTTRGFYTKEGFIIPSSSILPEQEWRIINTSFGDQFLELGLNGIIVATIGSHLGLPDLFDTQTGRTAIGRFGLMDGQSIFSYLGVFPPEPSAWEKQYLGWINPIVVNSDGVYTSRAASLDATGNSSVYKVLISAKEYFLIENRNRDAHKDGETVYFVKNGIRDQITFPKDVDGFLSNDIGKLKGNIVDVDELDWSLPGLKNDTADYQGGLLIWHIDENVIDAKFSSNTINTDINHRGVDVEEAKGSQDIGVVISTPLGDYVSDGFFVDFWYNGNHYRPSNVYQNLFNQSTFPNSNSYTGINSRICLSNFSAIDSSMTFQYQQCGTITNIANFPHFVGKDLTGNAQPIGIDFSRGQNKEAIFINSNKNLYGFKYNGMPIDTSNSNGTMFGIKTDWLPGYITNLNSLGGLYHTSLVTTFDSLIELRDFIINDSVNSSFGAIVFPNHTLYSSPAVIYDTNKIIEGNIAGRIVSLYIRPNQIGSFSDSVSNSKVSELSKSIDTLNNFIDSKNTFFAIGNIKELTSVDTIRVTNDNKILLNGNIISSNLGISNIYSSPVIADINKDGKQEIIFTADNKVHAINQNGVEIDNFPFSIIGVNKISSGIAVADLNGDGIMEVIFGTADGRIYAYNTSGKVLDGFPVLTGSEVKSTPAIINNNGKFGIIVYSQDGYLYGFKTPWAYDESRIMWKNYLNDKYHSNSNFKVSGISVSGPCLPKDKVYNWPNPAYGSSTNIRYYLGNDAGTVQIKIMDLAGELVTSLNGTNFKGFDNEAVWDISKVQSGIYIAVIQLTGGSCNETASIKIAVVK